jgi:mono/diheme cytochrome c family protein
MTLRLSLCGLAMSAIIVGLFQRDAQAEGDVKQGKVTAETWCTACHAVGPKGRGSDVASDFGSIARSRSDEYLRGFLMRPHPPMPRFELSRQDIDDLVAYLGSLRSR